MTLLFFKLFGLVRLVKFGIASGFATIIDHILFIFLNQYFIPGVSNLFSQFAGMLVNYRLQKTFIFKARRKEVYVLALSVMFSFAGLCLGSLLIHYLMRIKIFTSNPYLAKVFVTVILFLYNYFTKQYAFERKASI